MALVGQNYASGGGGGGGGGGSPLMIDSSEKRDVSSTNGTNGMSKLSQMQARFQQRQLQEKEQKLLRLYESQQQRAFQRVNRGSAGSSSVSSTTSSTTSSSSLGNGKVRQLFDERRTQTKPNSKTSGWDRSYPLEPLEPTRARQNRSTGLTRGASLERINNQPIKKVVSRSRSQVRPGNLINGGYADRSRQPQDYRSNYADEEYNYLQDELDAPYYHRDKNSNRFHNQDREIEQLFSNSRPNLYDNEEPLRDGETFDDTQLFKKLTNVGGILLMKERTMNDDKYKTYNANSRRVAPATKTTPREEASRRAPTQPLRRRDNDAEPTSPPPRAVTKAAVKRFEPTVSPPTTNGQITRKGVPPRTVNATNPPLRTASNTTRQAGPVTSTPRSSSSKPTAPKTAPSPRPSPRQTAPPQDNLSECVHCGRRFANDRVQMHQEICAKTGQKKRKVFDPVKQRVKGTEAEAYVKIAGKQQQKQAKEPAPKKSDWRRKHEEFINAIRAAKEVKAHLAAGGKLSDLPPPPPSENLDYVQCPHCSRRFNEAAAERHIPRCADMQHNKPKAKAQPAKAGGAFAKKR